MGLFHFDVSEELHDRMRIAKVKLKKDMTSILTEAIETYLKKRGL